MAVHLISARRLAEDLAAGRVTPTEQATYIAINSVLWLLPTFLYIARSPVSQDEPFSSAYWWTELTMLVLVNVGGIFYCLEQCRRDPERHFLIDFCCLWTPVALVWVVATWLLFYAALWALPRVLDSAMEGATAHDINFHYVRIHDLLLYLLYVGQMFAIYWMTGRYMRRTAELRG